MFRIEIDYGDFFVIEDERKEKNLSNYEKLFFLDEDVKKVRFFAKESGSVYTLVNELEKEKEMRIIGF